MANNFTSVINYFLKFTNFSFLQLSRIPYINVIIGIFFIFAFADIVFLIILHIRTRELKPFNHGFLNILNNSFLSPIDKVPLGYKRFSPLLEQSPADFYRFDRSQVSPILHNDDIYRFGTDSIRYQSAGGLYSFGGGLTPIGSGGLTPIGSGGLGSFGGSAGSFGGGLNPIHTKTMSESHTNLGLGGISRGGQYAVSSVVRGLDRISQENQRAEENRQRIQGQYDALRLKHEVENQKEADRVGKLYQDYLAEKEAKANYDLNLDYVETLLANNKTSTYAKLNKEANEDLTNQKIARYLSKNS